MKENLKVFKRMLSIEFYNSNNGSTFVLDNEKANIVVSGKQRLSILQDEMVIELINLNKNIRATLLQNTYDIVKVYVGYKSLKSKILIAVNKILNINTDFKEIHTTRTYILCSGKYTKNTGEHNLRISAGSNVYNTINQLCRMINIRAFIDKELQNFIISNDITTNNFLIGIERILKEHQEINVFHNNNNENYDIVFSLERLDKVIEITPDNGTLINSYIQIDNKGEILFEALPVYKFNVGDKIQIAKHLIENINNNIDNFQDQRIKENLITNYYKEGKTEQDKAIFTIYSIEFNLDIREQFSYKIKARKFNNTRDTKIRSGI